MTSKWLELASRFARTADPISFIARRFIARSGTANFTRANNSESICIDIGAGTCPYSREIREHLAATMYVPFDIAASDRTVVIGDAVAMPFRDSCANWVTSFDVIQHVANSDAALDEVVRVLRPGGHLLLTFPFNYCECDVQDFKRWTLSGMERELTSRGLRVLVMEQRGGRFFAFACALNWAVQHMVPGQRLRWRAPRSMAGISRAALQMLLTTPTRALQWLMLGLDRLFPNAGCYMGGIALAVKKHSVETGEQGI